MILFFKIQSFVIFFVICLHFGNSFTLINNHLTFFQPKTPLTDYQANHQVKKSPLFAFFRPKHKIIITEESVHETIVEEPLQFLPIDSSPPAVIENQITLVNSNTPPKNSASSIITSKLTYFLLGMLMATYLLTSHNHLMLDYFDNNLLLAKDTLNSSIHSFKQSFVQLTDSAKSFFQHSSGSNHNIHHNNNSTSLLSSSNVIVPIQIPQETLVPSITTLPLNQTQVDSKPSKQKIKQIPKPVTIPTKNKTNKTSSNKNKSPSLLINTPTSPSSSSSSPSLENLKISPMNTTTNNTNSEIFLSDNQKNSQELSLESIPSNQQNIPTNNSSGLLTNTKIEDSESNSYYYDPLNPPYISLNKG